LIEWLISLYHQQLIMTYSCIISVNTCYNTLKIFCLVLQTSMNVYVPTCETNFRKIIFLIFLISEITGSMRSVNLFFHNAYLVMFYWIEYRHFRLWFFKELHSILLHKNNFILCFPWLNFTSTNGCPNIITQIHLIAY
jgi:hypothetical protein